MPLFFVVSGFFLKNTPFAVWGRNGGRILIPYLIFSFVAIFIEYIKRLVLARPVLDFEKVFYGIFVWMDFPHLSDHYGFVLWFLPCLFLSKTLVIMLMKLTENWFLLFALGFIVSLLTVHFNVSFIFAIDEAMSVIFWIIFGLIVYPILSLKWVSIGSCVGLILLLYQKAPLLNISTKFYSDYFLNVSFAISQIFLFIGVSMFITHFWRRNNLLVLLGENSFMIFIFHPYTNNAAYIFTERIVADQWFLKLIISFVLLSPLIYMKKRYSNKWIFKYV